MENIKLGDLYSLKNHPFGNGFTDVKISALALMTPPILVVSEIQNSPKEYDSETGNEKSKQIRCIFFSHKTQRFENNWFDINILKEITEVNQEEHEESVRDDGDIQTKNLSNFTYPKTFSIEDIRNFFLYKQVVLKSCDLELGKLKTTFSQTDQRSVDKITAHLDFLSPVLTVIDVKLNDEKIGFNPKSGNPKKITSIFLLKCKWYNSFSGTFSEEFIPIETVEIIEHSNSAELVSRLILTKEFIKQKLEQPIKLENGVMLEHTYARPDELTFNHYKYKLKYYDFLRSKTLEMDLSDFKSDDDSAKIDDIILRKIPDYDSGLKKFNTVIDFTFNKNTYYRITYKDAKDRITDRIIYVKKFEPKTIIIADCLLRNGQERHFRVSDSSILKIEILEQKYFK
ncbi:hypothetical protein VUJ46_08925 [Chryseobacterium sp. MYb264]|uniref:hypothetical protein n=1 Tax=Chryseobacterium sp. MYb264 TaxID=2745153 RepID=UPI002E10E05B|nr:hypothetical protein VUJ46_08925 [Chryseobacterium sp. MYb264]